MRDNKDDQIWLRDIVESVDLIELYLSNVDESKFFSSIEKQDSINKTTWNNWRGNKKFIGRF